MLLKKNKRTGLFGSLATRMRKFVRSRSPAYLLSLALAVGVGFFLGLMATAIFSIILWRLLL